MCEADGENFVLTLAELRPVHPWNAADRFEGNSGYAEVGRFGLSPAAFAHLKQAMASAELYHTDHCGPLPDLEQFYKGLTEEIPRPNGGG
jgi:hypothetical protein